MDTYYYILLHTTTYYYILLHTTTKIILYLYILICIYIYIYTTIYIYIYYTVYVVNKQSSCLTTIVKLSKIYLQLTETLYSSK